MPQASRTRRPSLGALGTFSTGGTAHEKVTNGGVRCRRRHGFHSRLLGVDGQMLNRMGMGRAPSSAAKARAGGCATCGCSTCGLLPMVGDGPELGCPNGGYGMPIPGGVREQGPDRIVPQPAQPMPAPVSTTKSRQRARCRGRSPCLVPKRLEHLFLVALFVQCRRQRHHGQAGLTEGAADFALGQ